MKKSLGFLLLLLLCSCSEYVDRPTNLLSKKQMSTLIAEMAINDETGRLNPTANMETGTRYILIKNKVSASDFTESYKYYAITKKLEGILNNAQEQIKEKHPEAEKFIEAERKKNPQITPFQR